MSDVSVELCTPANTMTEENRQDAHKVSLAETDLDAETTTDDFNETTGLISEADTGKDSSFGR